MFPCLVRRGKIRFPRTIALETGSGKKLSYFDLDSKISNCENVIKSCGLAFRDRVIISCENSIECIVLVIAMWRVGITTLLVSPDIDKVQRENIKDTFDPNADICEEYLVKVFCNDFMPCKVDDKIPIFFDESDKVSCILTSGSMGDSKIVLSTYGNHIYSAISVNKNLSFGKNDKWYMTLKMHRIGGLAIIFRTFLAGGCIFLPQSNSISVDELRCHKISVISLVNAQLFKLCENIKHARCYMNNMKAIIVGGGAVNRDIFFYCRNNFWPILTTYGMSEMSSQISSTSPSKLGNEESSGEILRFCKVKIDNNGEILVKGKVLFVGYVKDDKVLNVIDKLGWFHTGDIGYLKNRELFVTGRMDSMITLGGEKIFPESIEKLLVSCDIVKKAIVVPIANKKYGNLLAAFVKTENDIANDALAIKEYLQKVLPPRKIPRWYFPWDKYCRDISDITAKPPRAFLQNIAKKLAVSEMALDRK